MKALAGLAWGLVIVAVDIRLNGADVVPDPLGWVIAVLALRPLGRLHPAYSLAALAGVVALALSIPDWLDPQGGPAALVTAGAQLAVEVAVLTGIVATVPARASRARLLRAWTVGLAVALVLFLALTEGASGLAVLALAAGLGQIGVFVWFLVFLVQVSKEPAPGGPGLGGRSAP